MVWSMFFFDGAELCAILIPQVNHDVHIGASEASLHVGQGAMWRQSLMINVIRATRLPATDIGGASDPYVQVCLHPDKIPS